MTLNVSALRVYGGIGARSVSLLCIAEREAPQQTANATGLAGCCSPEVVQQYMHSTPRVLMWPRAHVAAVLTLRQQEPIKSVDFSFVGAMRGDAKTSASRQWVRSFALRHFTNDS